MKTGFRTSAWVAAAMVAAPIAHAQVAAPVDSIEGVTLLGLGVAGAPDYMGSDHNKAYPAVVARYQFEGTQRYFTLLGPQAQLNILNSDTWRFGPQLTWRGQRGSDVDNPTVSQMVGINGTLEAGVFVQYRMRLSSMKMHQVTFTGDIAGSSNGTIGGVRMMWWQPMSQQIVVNLGAGIQYANDHWMSTYFGVSNPHDIKLYPSLGGQPFNASGGVKGFNIPFGLTYFVDRHWLLSAGGRYEKLNGDAKDSPVTSISGNSNQWVFGGAVSYMF